MLPLRFCTYFRENFTSDKSAFQVEQDEYLEGDEDNDTSSNQAVTTGSPTACGTPLSAEAKRKRRQEINRESARRVRKRKSEAHKKLQEEVILTMLLKSASLS